jgi:hypothetical protein
MPIISYFFGIVITMRHNDHPPAHVHAEYQGFEALIRIADGEIIEGKLPRPAARIVREWAQHHQAALMENWQKAEKLMPLEMIQGADND